MRLRLVLCGVIVALVAPLAGPVSAAPAPQLQVVLTSIEPRVLSPDGTLNLQGTIASDSPTTALHVEIWNGPSVTSRGILHQQRDDTFARLRQVPEVLEDVPGGRQVTPAAAVKFRLQVPVSALHLDRGRVNAIAVVVRGADGASGRANTFLPYFPDPDAISAPAQVNLVIPITADPPGPDAQASAAALADDTKAGGRLDAAAQAATASRPNSTHTRPSATTLAIDAGLLERLDPNSELISTLRTAASTAGVAIQSLPLDDADLDALEAAGDGRGVRQRILGAQGTVRSVLGTEVVANEPLLAPGGVLTSRALRSAAATSVILDGVLGADPTASSTPTALTTVGSTRALVTDPELQRLLTLADQAGPSERMSEQLLLAELAMITAEAPNAQPARSIVLLAPRHWNASPQLALQLVQDLAAVPWVTPTPLSTMLAGESASRSGSLPTTDAQALPSAGITAGDALRQQIASLNSLYGNAGAKETQALTRLVDSSESAAWRDQLSMPAALRSSVDAQIQPVLKGVSVRVGNKQFLTGDSGSVPVTVSSSLKQTVTVVLRLVRKSGAAQVVSSKTITIETSGDARPSSLQVSLPIKSRGADRFALLLELRAPNGALLGVPQSITVRRSNLGTFANAITITALAVLVLALAFRGTRGALRWRRRRNPDGGRHRPHTPVAGTS